MLVSLLYASRAVEPIDDLIVRSILERSHDHNLEHGSTGIIVLCTEHPEALFTLHSYVGTVPRLAGLSWGAEDLAAAVGASNQ